MNISKIQFEEKPILSELLSEYLIELNESTDYPYLDSYWKDRNRVPLKLTQENKWIGFALINGYCKIESNTISIAEFNILTEYRRLGYGKIFAKKIFDHCKGNWEVRTSLGNLIAIEFWRNIIADISIIEIKEIELNYELVFSFRN